jgi:hypothetical protein
MVKTNAPDQSVFYLTVTGNVENFVTIVPKRLTLHGVAGHPIKATAKIIPEKKYPFKIESVSVVNKKNISVKLEEAKDSKMTEYFLTVENLKKTTGRYFDTIKIKTDSNIRPEIKIHVVANISERHNGKKQ